MTVVSEYLEVASRVRRFLASDEVAKYWQYPSTLDQWTVAGLAGHLARPVLIIPGILAAEVPVDKPLASAVDYFAGIPADDLGPDSQFSAAVRERGVESAGDGQEDLLKRYDEVLADLMIDLPTQAPDREVVALGVRMQLRQYLITRMVEMMVHSDDLAVSIGTATPEFPAGATDSVISTLACIAARRHSTTDLLRALARSERAPESVSAF